MNNTKSTCSCCHRQIKTGKDGRIVMHGQKVAGTRSRCVPVGAECRGSFILPAEDPRSAEELAQKIEAFKARTR